MARDGWNLLRRRLVGLGCDDPCRAAERTRRCRRAAGYESTLRNLGRSGDSEILVALRGGQLIGTVTLQRWSADGELLRGPDEAEIRALAVAPADRGQGTGRALVAAVIDRAAASGVRHLVLCSLAGMHAAHRVYEQAGFSRLPERDFWPEPDLQLVAYGLILDGSRRPASG